MAGINPPKPPMFPTLKPTGAPTWCDPNQCADWGCEGMDSWCTCYQEGVDYPCEDDGEECQCLPKSCARSWTCPNGWKDKTDLGDRMMDIPCPNEECSNDICCTPPPTPSPTESPTKSPTGAPTKLSTVPMAYSCGNFLYMDGRNKRNTIIKGSNCVSSGVSSGPNAIPDCRSLRQTSQGARPTATSLTYRHSNRQTCHLNGNFRYSGASCSGKRVCQFGSWPNSTSYVKCRIGDFSLGQGGQPGKMVADTTCRPYQSYDPKNRPINMQCHKGVYTFTTFTPHGWYPGNRPALTQGEEFISMDMSNNGACV